jgi:hypothetical protein
MNASTRYMEHRWGTRVELDSPAELATAEGVCSDGRVCNASLSGAFVATTARIPLLSRVALRPLVPGGGWLDACVVRVETNGLALEWLEPGLHPVSALLALGRPTIPSAAASHRNPKSEQVVRIFPERHPAPPAP